MTAVADVHQFTQQPSEPPARRPLRDRLLTVSQLSTLPPMRPLIDGYLYRNTLAQLAGQPGCYKSFVAVAWSCSVALGMNWEGHRVPDAGPVVYAAAEGAPGLEARIKAWCEFSDVAWTSLEHRLYVLPEAIQLGDHLDVSEAVEAAQDLRALLLVLDTRARATVGLNENDSTDQGRAIAAAEMIQRDAGATVLGIHHTGRSGDHGRGSNAWDGAVWSDLRMKGEELRAVIHCEKHKDVPDGCDHHYRLMTHTVSEDLMPAYPDEKPEDYIKRRSTLVICPTSPLDESLAERRSARVVLDIVRTSAGVEGLTRPQIIALAEEQNVSRSSAYESVSALVEAAALRNIGTGKRPHYIADDPSTSTISEW